MTYIYLSQLSVIRKFDEHAAFIFILVIDKNVDYERARGLDSLGDVTHQCQFITTLCVLAL